MKRFAGSAVMAVLAVLFVSLPAIAHACPMCFVGGEQNQDAFLYGSLFLMIVPTATLGGLGYWAYRRIKAIDDGLLPPAAEETALDQPSQSRGNNAVVLQMPPRS